MKSVPDLAAIRAPTEHKHRFEQCFEQNRPGCTVKIWECPCGAWNIRHFGCFNKGHDQDTLATLSAVVEALEEARGKLTHPTYGDLFDLVKEIHEQMGRGDWPRMGQMGALLDMGRKARAAIAKEAP